MRFLVAFIFIVGCKQKIDCNSAWSAKDVLTEKDTTIIVCYDGKCEATEETRECFINEK